jgi:hypothetical protein
MAKTARMRWALVLLGGMCLAVACGGDDDGVSTGSGGTGGSATGRTGGTASTSGSAGSAGSGVTGDAGATGAGANAVAGVGTAGAGGSGNVSGAGGASASGGQGGATAATVLEFCSRLGRAFCDHVERCGCGADATQACRDLFSEHCADEYWAGVAAAVAAGDLAYHPEAVQSALAPLADSAAPCHDLFIDLGWDSVAVQTFDGVFSGTHELGSACTLVSGRKGGIHDCREGLLCRQLGDQDARCVALVGLGEGCDADSAQSLCFERRPPDRDNEYASSFDSLICVPDASGAAAGVCSRDLENGQPCHADENCASGRCFSLDGEASTCAPMASNGQACHNGSDCLSGSCTYDTDPGVCSTPLADGEPCGYDDESCASGSCHSPDDQTSGASPGVCGPRLERAVGEGCTQGYECASRVCRLDLCWEPICRRFL